MRGGHAIRFILRGVPDAFRQRARLRRWLNAVAREEGRGIASLNYVLMDDQTLLGYNRQYLDHDELTDVITFPYGEGVMLEGEVLISLDRVKDNARDHHTTTADELRRVMVHGLLHLCGHRDKLVREGKAMRVLEERYLALWRSMVKG